MRRADAGESHATVTVARRGGGRQLVEAEGGGARPTGKSGRTQVICNDGASSMNGPNDVVKASPGRMPNSGPTTSRWAARAPWV